MENADCEPCSSSQYEPKSLAECLELLSGPVHRDHILVRDVDNWNQLSIQEVITGIGTEQIAEFKKRTDTALHAVHLFAHEITPRTTESLGLSLIKSLLCLEVDTDGDGVPLDESEAEICDNIARLFLRIEAVSKSRTCISDFVTRALLDKETLVYNKYKLLKSLRVGFRSLASRRTGVKTILDDHNLNALVSVGDSRSKLALLNDFAANISSAFDCALVGILWNKDEQLTKSVLFAEIVQTILDVADCTQDVSLIGSSVMQISEYVRETTDIEVVKCVLRMILADRRTLVEILNDHGGAAKLRGMITRLQVRPDLPKDLAELIDAINDCVAPPML